MLTSRLLNTSMMVVFLVVVLSLEDVLVSLPGYEPLVLLCLILLVLFLGIVFS